MPEEKRAAPRRRKRKHTPYFGPALLFFITLGRVTALAWCLPLRPSVSEKEKRELEKFPEFTLSSVADGSYFEQIGLWFSDTFPLRDRWIDTDQAIKRLHGSSDIVIYGETENADEIPAVIPTAVPAEARETPAPVPAPAVTDEPETTAVPETTAAPETTAVPETTVATEEKTDEDIEWGGKVIEEEDLVTTGAVIQIGDSAFEYTGFSQQYSEMYAANITRAGELLRGRARVFNVFVLHSATLMLPRDYRESIGCAPEEDVLEYVNSLLGEDVIPIDTFTPLLRHNSEYIFFRTDHHWTALGAWYAYEEWAKRAGFEPVGLENYTEDVQEPFYGTLFYKARQNGKLKPDQVFTYDPPGDVHLYLETQGKDSLEHLGFEQSVVTRVKGSDKYMAFLAGDHPLSTFVNNDINDDSACLIIKNSNGNPFCYYFTQHYHTVYVMDYRKYTHRTLTDFVDYYGVSDVIFCLSAGQAQSYGGNQLLKRIIQ